MSKILVIPDMHHHKRLLEIWDKCKRKVGHIVLLGDFFDDFEVPKNSLDPYQDLHKELLKRNNSTKVSWVHGNHELSYTWNRPVTGNIELSVLRAAVKEMTGKIFTFSQPIVVIDNCIFSHAGISKAWYEQCKHWIKQDIEAKVCKDYETLDLNNPIDLAEYTKLDCWFGPNKIQRYWSSNSPLWFRPDLYEKDQIAQFKGYWQFAGHTPMEEITVDNDQRITYLDVFSATRVGYDLNDNLVPVEFGCQECVIVDSKTGKILETVC